MILPCDARIDGSGRGDDLSRDVDWTVDAVLAVDNRGIVRLANARAAELFGYSPEEMENRPVTTLVKGRGPEGGAAVGLRRDGECFPTTISLCSVATEDGLLMLAVLRDASPEGQRRTHRRSASPVRPQTEEGDTSHRLKNTLAAICNYAELAADGLRNEVRRRGLSGEEFSAALADIERISAAARESVAAAPAATTTDESRPPGDAREMHPTAGRDYSNDDFTTADPPCNRGRTILLVDDDPLIRHSAGRLLRQEGYAVIEAAGLDAALAASAAHPGNIDLLLTDFAMPGGGGAGLRAALELARPDTRVLFMTGYGHRAFVRRALLAGGDHVIYKPFSARDLYREVSQILQVNS